MFSVCQYPKQFCNFTIHGHIVNMNVMQTNLGISQNTADEINFSVTHAACVSTGCKNTAV